MIDKKDTIKIKRSSRGYTAVMVDGQRRANVVKLFGTNEIPTGFNEGASYDDVIREISRLNPECYVIKA